MRQNLYKKNLWSFKFSFQRCLDHPIWTLELKVIGFLLKCYRAAKRLSRMHSTTLTEIPRNTTIEDIVEAGLDNGKRRLKGFWTTKHNTHGERYYWAISTWDLS